MHLSLNLYYNYVLTNLIVFTVFAFTSVIGDDIECSIGVLDACPSGQTCLESGPSLTIGRCVCPDNCSATEPTVSTVKPLPIYSDNDNSNKSSIIISSIFGSIFLISVVFTTYYFGVRKGIFRELWRRTFTQGLIEHQLLDRSPRTEDANDSEAIA